MSTTRYFSGGRDKSGPSIASQIMRIEMQKKGKMDPAARYKLIFKKRLDETQEKARGLLKAEGRGGKALSKRAETALKQIAQKKAAKEAKTLRRMVIVTPRNYQNGSIDKKGKIYDVAGNQVAAVNLKNGRMATMLGTGLGKYKPKSLMTDLSIQETITKHSPYFINLRKLQAMQAGAEAAAHHTINITHEAPRGNKNIHGAAADTVWGTSFTNVWGVASKSGSVWGKSGGNVWGGKNYFESFGKGIGKFIKSLF